MSDSSNEDASGRTDRAHAVHVYREVMTADPDRP